MDSGVLLQWKKGSFRQKLADGRCWNRRMLDVDAPFCPCLIDCCIVFCWQSEQGKRKDGIHYLCRGYAVTWVCMARTARPGYRLGFGVSRMGIFQGI